MTEEERKAAAKELFANWASKAKVIGEMGAAASPSFARELSNLAMDHAFGDLWVRPGLGLRERSMFTLGILIALRAYEELTVHFPIAIANGVTVQEIEELIYHASAYAGFPAANSARVAATESLRKQGLID